VLACAVCEESIQSQIFISHTHWAGKLILPLNVTERSKQLICLAKYSGNADDDDERKEGDKFIRRRNNFANL